MKAPANPTTSPTPKRTYADGWTGHDYIEDEDVAPEPWRLATTIELLRKWKEEDVSL